MELLVMHNFCIHADGVTGAEQILGYSQSVTSARFVETNTIWVLSVGVLRACQRT